MAGIQQVYLEGGAQFARLVQDQPAARGREEVNPWGDSLPILRSLKSPPVTSKKSIRPLKRPLGPH